MGLPVLTIAEGKHLGAISRLLVRPETRSVEAVGIGGGAFSHPSGNATPIVMPASHNKWDHITLLSSSGAPVTSVVIHWKVKK